MKLSGSTPIVPTIIYPLVLSHKPFLLPGGVLICLSYASWWLFLHSKELQHDSISQQYNR